MQCKVSSSVIIRRVSYNNISFLDVCGNVALNSASGFHFFFILRLLFNFAIDILKGRRPFVDVCSSLNLAFHRARILKRFACVNYFKALTRKII